MSEQPATHPVRYEFLVEGTPSEAVFAAFPELRAT